MNPNEGRAKFLIELDHLVDGRELVTSSQQRSIHSHESLRADANYQRPMMMSLAETRIFRR